MADIQSPTAEIRRGKEEERRKKKKKKIEITGQKYNTLFHRAAIIMQAIYTTREKI